MKTKQRKKNSDCCADEIRAQVAIELSKQAERARNLKPKDDRIVQFTCRIPVSELVTADPEKLIASLGRQAYKRAIKGLADGGWTRG